MEKRAYAMRFAHLDHHEPSWETAMITLYLRYTIDPNKLSAFEKYVAEEQQAISESGGAIAGYYAPSDFAGATSEGYGLIDFPSLAEYEIYRAKLAAHPLHKDNVAALEKSGAVLSTYRALIRRIKPRAKDSCEELLATGAR
jgi:hypothetical protein